ncbi:MAG: hypothetical protein QOI71_3976, partial [Gaiellales bacterium]|nr:hypothetical protein [Gaiellales bacterium]
LAHERKQPLGLLTCSLDPLVLGPEASLVTRLALAPAHHDAPTARRHAHAARAGGAGRSAMSYAVMCPTTKHLDDSSSPVLTVWEPASRAPTNMIGVSGREAGAADEILAAKYAWAEKLQRPEKPALHAHQRRRPAGVAGRSQLRAAAYRARPPGAVSAVPAEPQRADPRVNSPTRGGFGHTSAPCTRAAVTATVARARDASGITASRRPGGS